MYINSFHQEKQVEVINTLEEQVKSKSINFTTVTPVEDYATDNRICLTSVHLPNQELITKIRKTLIEPLKEIAPDYFYYPDDSLHMTIKNVRVVNDPPHFTKEDIVKAEEIFGAVIPKHKKFSVYFYRLLLFPNNIALVGTTDPELDNIFLDLERELRDAGVPGDNKYINSRYFFSNMTLARFSEEPTKEFIEKFEELSKSIYFDPYIVDSVTLLSCNAVFKNKNIINTWRLKEQ